MKPQMRQSMILDIPAVDETGQIIIDRNGFPEVTQRIVPARVRSKDNLIQTASGTEYDTNIEIDYTADLDIQGGTEITFTRIDGTTAKGTVVDTTETVNLAASKILFRTAFVNGR